MSGISYMGRHVIADLHDVSAEVLGSIDFWKEILIDGAKKSGATVLSDHFHHFGEGNKAGFTLVQLIETSNICAHFCNDTGDAYIDVFSCKPYDRDVVRDEIIKFFKPRQITVNYIERQA